MAVNIFWICPTAIFKTFAPPQKKPPRFPGFFKHVLCLQNITFCICFTPKTLLSWSVVSLGICCQNTSSFVTNEQLWHVFLVKLPKLWCLKKKSGFSFSKIQYSYDFRFFLIFIKIFLVTLVVNFSPVFQWFKILFFVVMLG